MRARRRLLALGLVLVFGAVACGGEDDVAGDTGGDTTPTTDGGATATDGDSDADTDGDTGEEDPLAVDTSKEINVTMGSTNAQSSAYSLFTTHGRLAGDADGNMTINVRETAASAENIQLVNDGDVEFGISSWELLYQAVEGLGDYEGNAHPDLVPIFTYLQVAEFMVARAEAMDSEEPTLDDLVGMDVAPSSQGASTYAKWANIFDVLDIDIKTFDGSLEDVVNAMKDGRIAAFGKSANGLGPDASMLDVASATDVIPVTLTDDHVATLKAEVPFYNFTTIEAGAMSGWPAFQTPVITAVYFVHKDMPDDEVFRLTKALVESLEQAAQDSGYAGSQGIPLELTMETVDQLPLHPAALEYFEARGVG